MNDVLIKDQLLSDVNTSAEDEVVDNPDIPQQSSIPAQEESTDKTKDSGNRSKLIVAEEVQVGNIGWPACRFNSRQRMIKKANILL